MIISTKKGTPKDELEKIVDKFEKQGLDVTLITGKDYNVFGLVGDTTKIDERDVLANPWIDNVTRVSAPYKRANRLFHPADSVIDCGGGIVKKPENLRALHQNGVILFIDRPVDALAVGGGRPLSSSMDALRQMEAQRRPLYLAAADAVIPNNGTLDDALHAAMEALDEIFDS